VSLMDSTTGFNGEREPFLGMASIASMPNHPSGAGRASAWVRDNAAVQATTATVSERRFIGVIVIKHIGFQEKSSFYGGFSVLFLV
jgi:hypothetical protein